MYLKCHHRFKDGKEHRYWSIAEKRRCLGGRVVDRHVLYLGEINDSQKESWIRCIEAFDESGGQQRRLALFPADRPIPAHAEQYGVQVLLQGFRLHRPRQWGACWAFWQVWTELGLDRFWEQRLPPSREGTSWYRILTVLTAYRLIDPGSEWRLHRQWYEQSAMGDLLGEDYGLVAKDNLYRCLDKLLAHKEELFSRYGKARRIWVMDRGIPTEAHLAQMRERGVSYLVGTPKGRLQQLEQRLASLPWDEARPSVRVKLLPNGEELYVWVQSQARIHKERAMRRRKLKRLWARLKALQKQQPTYETLLLKIGAACKEAGRTRTLVRITLPEPPARGERSRRVDFTFTLDKAKLRAVRQREGRYLLRSNLTETDPALLWEFYLQLVEVEAAFKNLKSDLAVRPIFHQREQRVEAHIFVAFLSYCIQVTLQKKLRYLAPGLTVRQVLEKLSAIEMLDVHFPTTDGRELRFTRYTQPEAEQKMIIARLGWNLPEQPPPRLGAKRELKM